MPPVCLSSSRKQSYSDKLTLSFDVLCRKMTKSESLVPSRQPDFAGMMRPGHHQSTNFGLSAALERVSFNAPLTREQEAQSQPKRSAAVPGCSNVGGKSVGG